jgi:hypothetical protein
VDFLYTLYDALVSINVPSDKARAVVDAMERDMGTTLATKKDLEVQGLATRQDLEILRREIESRFVALNQDMLSRFAALTQDMESRFVASKQDMDSRFALLDQKIDSGLDRVELRMTVKLGSMMMLGFGLVIAALRIWA